MPGSKTAVTERIIIGGENNSIVSAASRLSPEMAHKFDGKSKEVTMTYIGTTVMSHDSFISLLS
jgi:hypothetical protein